MCILLSKLRHLDFRPPKSKKYALSTENFKKNDENRPKLGDARGHRTSVARGHQKVWRPNIKKNDDKRNNIKNDQNINMIVTKKFLQQK